MKLTVPRLKYRVLCWKPCRNVKLLSAMKLSGCPNHSWVLATQNPIEQEGTYPLPEAQVDRFMLKVVIDYPKLEEEKLIIRQNINGDKFEVKPILKADEIIEARKVVRQVYLDEKNRKNILLILYLLPVIRKNMI